MTQENCKTCDGHHHVCDISGKAPCNLNATSEPHYLKSHHWIPCPDCQKPDAPTVEKCRTCGKEKCPDPDGVVPGCRNKCHGYCPPQDGDTEGNRADVREFQCDADRQNNWCRTHDRGLTSCQPQPAVEVWEEKYDKLWDSCPSDDDAKGGKDIKRFISNLLQSQAKKHDLAVAEIREAVRKATVACGQWDKETHCEAVDAIDELIKKI